MEPLGPSTTCGQDKESAGCDSKDGFRQKPSHIATPILDVGPQELGERHFCV